MPPDINNDGRVTRNDAIRLRDTWRGTGSQEDPAPSDTNGDGVVSQGELDAVVYDYSTLHYLVHKDYPGKLNVLSRTFNHKFFGLPLPPDSPLRRPLNKAILEVMETPMWRKILKSYMGKDAVPTSLPFVLQSSGQKELGR